MGQQNKIKFFLCFERWRVRKREEQTAKNPFNFAVAEEIITHHFEQKPITDNEEFQPDLPKVENLAVSDKNVAYPPSDPRPRYVYPPTVVSIKQFDEKFKLPKQRVSEKALARAEERKKKN